MPIQRQPQAKEEEEREIALQTHLTGTRKKRKKICQTPNNAIQYSTVQRKQNTKIINQPIASISKCGTLHL